MPQTTMKPMLITTLTILVVLMRGMPTVVSKSVVDTAVEYVSGCEVDGKRYKVGESYNNGDPCTTCVCGSDGTPFCMSAMCTPPACVDFEFDDDHCCAVCPDGQNCEGPNGEVIPAGQNIPITEPGLNCVCNVDGVKACFEQTVRD